MMPDKDHLGRMCGFLHIDDKKKKFQKRFFLLNRDRRHLELYSNDPSIENSNAGLCEEINLNYVTNVDEAKKTKVNHCFVINTVYRSYYVQASSKVEMAEWLELINDASRIIVPPEALRPPHTTLNDISEHCEQQLTTPRNNSPVSVNGKPNAADESSTRTEIVGNVVVKKKVGGGRKLSFEESRKPHVRLRHSVDLNRNLTMGPGNQSPRRRIPTVVEDQEVVKQGWLSKQNRSKKTYKPRFVILRNDGLLYYKSDRLDKEPLQYIPVHEVLGAKVDEEEELLPQDNNVTIITVHRAYYFQAESQDDMRSWVDAIDKTVRESKIPSKSNKLATFRESSGLSGSAEILNEGRSPLLSPRFFDKHRKKSSLGRVSYPRSSQDSIGQSAHSSTDSLDGDPICEVYKPVKQFTYPDTPVEAADPVVGERKGQSSKRLSTVSSNLSTESGSGKPHSNRRSGHEDFVSTHLDPQIDNRSAVKPSLLKKKKTLGIIFSFNNMLMKKREKVQKEMARQKNELKDP